MADLLTDLFACPEPRTDAGSLGAAGAAPVSDDQRLGCHRLVSRRLLVHRSGDILDVLTEHSSVVVVHAWRARLRVHS